MIAVTVIMVLSLLSAAVIARTASGVKSTRQGQDFSNALANADAGLSDALFRIDQKGNAAASQFCVGQSSDVNNPCTLAQVPGAPTVQYTARRVDDNTYQVFSKGLVNGQPHAIEATVSRSFTYPYVVFAKNGMTFDGNVGNYSPPCGTPCAIETVDASNNFVSSPAPDVASNGQITCQGGQSASGTNGPSPAHSQNYYKGGGTDCGNGSLKTGTYNPLDPVSSCPAPPNNPPTPCVPSGSHICPVTNGVIQTPLLPGVYVCNQTNAVGGTISFPSTWTYGGSANDGLAVELYIIPTDGSAINLSIANDDVNLAGGFGDPTQLRVYMAGAGKILEGSGAHAGSFTGIMYAPSADATSNACKADWRGGIVVSTFTCNGGPHLSIKYDTRMLNLVSSTWTVTDYTEIPSKDVVLP